MGELSEKRRNLIGVRFNDKEVEIAELMASRLGSISQVIRSSVEWYAENFSNNENGISEHDFDGVQGGKYDQLKSEVQMLSKSVVDLSLTVQKTYDFFIGFAYSYFYHTDKRDKDMESEYERSAIKRLDQLFEIINDHEVMQEISNREP